MKRAEEERRKTKQEENEGYKRRRQENEDRHKEVLAVLNSLDLKRCM